MGQKYGAETYFNKDWMWKQSDVICGLTLNSKEQSSSDVTRGSTLYNKEQSFPQKKKEQSPI